MPLLREAPDLLTFIPECLAALETRSQLQQAASRFVEIGMAARFGDLAAGHAAIRSDVQRVTDRS